MKLLSEKMAKDLTNLSGLLFIGNSILDNMTYQLSVKFVMPRTTDILHLHFAHDLPLLADKITEYADDRNVYLHRPNVPANTEDFSNIKEIFDKVLSYMVDVEKLTATAIESAIEENDTTTKVFLDGFLRDLIPYTKIALGFVDYVEMNGYSPKDCMFMELAINHFMGIEPEFKTIEVDD